MVQDTGGGIMEGGVFSWHISGTLLSIKYSLNAAICLDIVADNVSLFLATVSPSTGGHSNKKMNHLEPLVVKEIRNLHAQLTNLELQDAVLIIWSFQSFDDSVRG